MHQRNSALAPAVEASGSARQASGHKVTPTFGALPCDVGETTPNGPTQVLLDYLQLEGSKVAETTGPLSPRAPKTKERPLRRLGYLPLLPRPLTFRGEATELAQGPKAPMSDQEVPREPCRGPPVRPRLRGRGRPKADPKSLAAPRRRRWPQGARGERRLHPATPRTPRCVHVAQTTGPSKGRLGPWRQGAETGRDILFLGS